MRTWATVRFQRSRYLASDSRLSKRRPFSALDFTYPPLRSAIRFPLSGAGVTARARNPVFGEGGVDLTDVRVVQAGADDRGLQVVVLLCPTGLCGQGQPEAPSQSCDASWRPETGHITQAV